MKRNKLTQYAIVMRVDGVSEDHYSMFYPRYISNTDIKLEDSPVIYVSLPLAMLDYNLILENLVICLNKKEDMLIDTTKTICHVATPGVTDLKVRLFLLRISNKSSGILEEKIVNII